MRGEKSDRKIRWGLHVTKALSMLGLSICPTLFGVDASASFRCEEVHGRALWRDLLLQDVHDYHESLETMSKRTMFKDLRVEKWLRGNAFRKTLQARLAEQGYLTEVGPQTTLVLKADPSHSFGKLVGHLNDRNFQVLIDPSMWRRAVGAINDLYLYMDLQSLIEGRASHVLAHELRHVYDELEARKTEGENFRLFQTFVDARGYHTGTMPAFFGDVGNYSKAYVLDEIPAYRLTLALDLREFERTQDQSLFWRIYNRTVLLRKMIDNFHQYRKHFENEFYTGGLEFSIGRAFKDDIKDSLALHSTEHPGLKIWLDLTEEESESLKTEDEIKAFVEKRLKQLKLLGAKLEGPLYRLHRVCHQAKLGQDSLQLVAELHRQLREIQRVIQAK